jgi:predicted nucleotidyltransferase
MTLAEFLKSATARPELQRQAELLKQLESVLRQDLSCLGAAVAGSIAAGTADRLSDIDLVVFCASGSSLHLLANLREVAETDAVLYHLAGWHDDHSPYEKTILANLCSYEFHMIEPPTQFTLKKPYIALVNRSLTLESRFSQEKAPTRSQQTPYHSGKDGLAWELFNCFKWACRQETDDVGDYVVRLGQALSAAKREA